MKNKEITVLKENTNRIIYFDILNIIACIAVCYLHCNGGVHGYSNTRLWKECLVIEVICYFAVPIFIMLSGATLMKYRERYTTKQFFLKRAEKILIPWVIWSFITYIVHNKNLNLLNFTNDFLYGKIETVYWFFPLIIYLYCIIPVISILTEDKHRKLMWGIVIFIFSIQSVLQPILTILKIQMPSILGYMTGQNAYIMYLLLGYLLSTTKLNRKQRITIYMLAIIALTTRYLHTIYGSISVGKLNKASWGYTAFTGVLPTIAVFESIKNINWNNILSKIKIKSKYISILASCSFGVYLMHILIKSKLTSFFLINTQSYFYRLIFPIILYACCACIVYIIKKIPIVRKIVP